MQDIYDEVIPAGGGGGLTQPAMAEEVLGGAPNGSAGAPVPAGVAGQAGAVAAPPTINEEDLYGALDEVDPNASVADLPPPVPDGWYLMKATIHQSTKKHIDPRLKRELPGELKFYKDNKTGATKYTYKINVGLECVDEGPQKGKKAVLFADSFLFGGTSICDDLVGAIYGKKLEQRTLPQLRDAILTGLAKEPIIGVRREWQAQLENRKDAAGDYLKDRETLIRRGQDSFPKDAGGKSIPLRSVPNGPHQGEPCRTTSEIVQVAHRSLVPKAGGGARTTAGGQATGGSSTGSAVEVLG